MCKIKGIKTGIKDLDFKRRGRISARLDDGREIIAPLSLFPDIKKLSMKQREEWMILDDQFFTFNNLTKIYSIKDLMGLA